MGDDEGESVQVAVRMRVFNKREQEAGSSRIIRMERHLKGSNTYIINPENGEEKKFQYDYSFQSHSATEPGIGDYATQETVFNDLGRPVMDAALEGRNICLFAYGQTGAGKSFSMLGKPEEPGIIPRTCDAIFGMIDGSHDVQFEYTVDIQVVEIYCEIINDLLSDRKKWPPGGFKPRLTDKGYVVDTVRKPCFNYPDIESAFKFADQNRSVGSHALNPESSRAHTIYTINYERRKKHETGKIIETVTSRLNLVDLAGSERTESAGTTGQMLKEGNAINLSLTALGSCIKSLSERKKPNFRDSKLTLLLQGSMTNGKVVMIAAVSPASLCYDESMSTLRFADRIKQVKIKANKNVTLDPVADMKRAMEDMRTKMQEEIDKLRSKTDGKDDPEALDSLNKRLAEQAEENDALKRAFEERMKQLSEDAEERVRRAAEISNMQQGALGGASLLRKEDVKDPHLLNLHEDNRLAETLVYPLKAGTTVIGRTNKERPPDLEFNGMGIVKNHATIENIDGRVSLTPGPRSRTLVNGKPIDTKIELKHNMRVWLGNNYAFRFSYPGHESAGEVFDDPPDYYFAEQEIAENASLEVTGCGIISSTLNHKLSEALKKVEQANIIAMDLGKHAEFEAKIFKNRLTGESDVVVRVTSPNGELHWPWEKFNSRVVDFVKEWQQWQYAEEKGEKYKPPPETEDPFNDSEYQLIGEADIWLQSLANMIENDVDASVLAVTGVCEGRVKATVNPCDKHGGEGPWDDNEEMDPFVDDPKELMGEEVQFALHIHSILFDNNNEGNSCKFTNIWIRYKVNPKNSEEEWSRTAEVVEPSFNPKLNYSKKHRVKVDQDIFNLITKGRIILQVWGKLSKEAGSHTGQTVNKSSARKTELAKLDAEIAEKRRILSELDRQIEEKKKLTGKK